MAHLRRTLQAALSHKALANDLLDNVKSMQDSYNAIAAKVAADTAIALDTNYAATVGAISVIDLTKRYGEMYRAIFLPLFKKKIGRAVIANDISDAIKTLQQNMAALLIKLDAEAGTLASIDFASSLSVDVLDVDTPVTTGAYRTTPRKIINGRFANKRLAQGWIAAIIDTQVAFNALLAALDAKTLTAASAVEVFNADRV
jgi:hypothetical protein